VPTMTDFICDSIDGRVCGDGAEPALSEAEGPVLAGQSPATTQNVLAPLLQLRPELL